MLALFTPVEGLEAALLNQRCSFTAEPEVELSIVIVLVFLIIIIFIICSTSSHAADALFPGRLVFFLLPHPQNQIPVFCKAILMISTVVEPIG